MGKVHDLKIWPGYFSQVLSGNKTFEIRRDDGRNFEEGDILVLREWRPSMVEKRSRRSPVPIALEPDPKRGEYTGRAILRRVGHVCPASASAFGSDPMLAPGVVVMSIAEIDNHEPEIPESELERLPRP